MAGLVLRVVVIGALAIAAGVSLVGLSGMIIFADLKTPSAQELASEALSKSTNPSVMSRSDR